MCMHLGMHIFPLTKFKFMGQGTPCGSGPKRPNMSACPTEHLGRCAPAQHGSAVHAASPAHSHARSRTRVHDQGLVPPCTYISIIIHAPYIYTVCIGTIACAMSLYGNAIKFESMKRTTEPTTTPPYEGTPAIIQHTSMLVNIN